MPRIRTIKPDFWRSDNMAQVSAEACLLAIGLLNCADDEGYFSANTGLLKADIFPLRELSGSVPELLQELSRIGYIQLFEDDSGKPFGLVVNFTDHQVINKPTPSKIKGLHLLPKDYGSNTVVLPTGRERKGKEKEGKGRESAKPSAVACPPNVNDSTWNDWLALRKAKRAPVTQTVVDHAEREAEKAGLTLDAFLKVWCARGSQGLEASWLKPDERQRYGASPNARIDSGMEAVQRAKLMLFGGGDEI